MVVARASDRQGLYTPNGADAPSHSVSTAKRCASSREGRCAKANSVVALVVASVAALVAALEASAALLARNLLLMFMASRWKRRNMSVNCIPHRRFLGSSDFA
eukprot:1409669-Pleurochrysis_carterae.AAC.1